MSPCGAVTIVVGKILDRAELFQKEDHNFGRATGPSQQAFVRPSHLILPVPKGESFGCQSLYTYNRSTHCNLQDREDD